MTNTQKSSVEGVVSESLPNATFRVKVTGSEQAMLCNLAGKMRTHWVRILPGDRVIVEIDEYDPNRGRIVSKLR